MRRVWGFDEVECLAVRSHKSGIFQKQDVGRQTISVQVLNSAFQKAIFSISFSPCRMFPPLSKHSCIYSRFAYLLSQGVFTYTKTGYCITTVSLHCY